MIRELMHSEIERLETAATGAEILETEYMDTAVFDLARRAAEEGDDSLAETYRFMSGVLRSAVENLGTIETLTNQFWVKPGSLSDVEVDLLRKLVSSLADPELRARFADYVWLSSRDRRFAEIAVDEYLASAFRLRDPEKWTGCAGRYERAVAVAASLGKKHERYSRAIETIELYLAELNGEDPLFLSERLMTILLEQKKGDRENYAALAEKCARGAEKRGNFYLALHYWNVKVRWHAAMNDPQGERQARMAAADSVVKDGETRAHGEQPSFLAAADLVRRGLAMLQKAGAPEVRVNEVAARLKEYQTRSLDELKPLNAKFDATALINEAREAVAGKTLPEGILAFVELIHIPKRNDVRRQVLRRAKRFVFSHLFGEIHLNQDGAAVAGRGSVSGNEGEAHNVLALMYQDLIQGFSIQAQTTIEPAWRQLQDEHELREDQMSVIVQQSWFVPPDREPFFAKGLAAGFNGDLITSIHLLVPQIEPAIRWHLQRRGVNTARFNPDGYHEERDLNQLLAMPEAKRLLGDRAHLALTGILTSRFGYNLRNNLAHGLIAPRDCYSVICLFLWALVLQICVRTTTQSDDEWGAESRSEAVPQGAPS